METTGNVFDPEFYLVDTETQVVYRKEQFSRKEDLPVELIVRDRRFTRREIEKMCNTAGFTVEFSRYVKVGDWLNCLCSTDKAAKEILVKCKKPYQSIN